MNEIETFYLELLDLGITFTSQDDRLTYRAPRGVMTPQLKQRLLAEKPFLLALIQDTGGFLYPRLPDGFIDFARLATQLPPLLEGEEIPTAFQESPCRRCGQLAQVCRRADGLVLCACYWTWNAPGHEQQRQSHTWLGYRERRSA